MAFWSFSINFDHMTSLLTFIFPSYFALIFPTWPRRAACQCFWPFLGFFKTFFMVACFVPLSWDQVTVLHHTNSLKPKGLLAVAMEWKGMSILFFFVPCRMLILCCYYERAVMLLYSILTSASFCWAPRAESCLSSAWVLFHCWPWAHQRHSCTCLLVSELRVLDHGS